MHDTVRAIAQGCAILLTAGESVEVTTGGIRLKRIRMEWTASPDGFLSHYEVRHKPTADSEWVFEPNVQPSEVEAFTQAVNDTVQHTVEIRAVNVLGVASSWLSGTITPDAIVYPASIVSIVHEWVGDSLFVTVAGDAANTRTSGGLSIVGDVGLYFTTSGPTIAAHDFSISNARDGRVDTGFTLANPGPGVTFPVLVRCRAVNAAGVEGDVFRIVATRVGYETAGSGTIDTFTNTYGQGGTACTTDPAQSSVAYSVTKAGSDTVTIERWVDGANEATILSASTTASNTIADDLEFYEDGINFTPTHSVKYHLLLKTSGGTTITDAWTDEVTFVGVVDC